MDECVSILILSGVSGDTRRYRSLHLQEQCELAGVQVRLAHIADAGLMRLVSKERFDIAVFQRVEMDAYVKRLLGVLKTAGTLNLYDSDDLVFEESMFQFIDSPDFSDPIRASLYRKNMRRQRQMLLACDAALVSTAFLAEQVKKLGKVVRIHRNAFSLQMLACAEATYRAHEVQREGVVMGYASGTRTHDRDFSVAATALRAVLEIQPQASLWLVGPVDPGVGWEKFGERVKRFPAVDWRKLPEYLVQFDINLAPLSVDNPFAQSKSAIKFMEAALVRRPTIASGSVAFEEAICDGENGFIADNEGQWTEKLLHLVQEPGLRARMGEKAYQDIMASDHPMVRSQELFETLNDLHLQLRGKKLWRDGAIDAKLIQQRVEKRSAAGCGYTSLKKRDIYYLRRGWVTLWRRGPLELLGGVWVGLRRLIAPIFPFRLRDEKDKNKTV